MKSRLYVLIVEDDADIRDYLAEIIHDHLQEKGLDVQVDAAEDGAEGLKKLKGLRYDLILTDLRMPFLTGLQMIRRKAEEDSASRETPTVIITGNRDDTTEEEVEGLEIIDKPLQLTSLYKVLDKYLISGPGL